MANVDSPMAMQWIKSTDDSDSTHWILVNNDLPDDANTVYSRDSLQQQLRSFQVNFIPIAKTAFIQQLVSTVQSVLDSPNDPPEAVQPALTEIFDLLYPSANMRDLAGANALIAAHAATNRQIFMPKILQKSLWCKDYALATTIINRVLQDRHDLPHSHWLSQGVCNLIRHDPTQAQHWFNHHWQEWPSALRTLALKAALSQHTDPHFQMVRWILFESNHPRADRDNSENLATTFWHAITQCRKLMNRWFVEENNRWSTLSAHEKNRLLPFVPIPTMMVCGVASIRKIATESLQNQLHHLINNGFWWDENSVLMNTTETARHPIYTRLLFKQCIEGGKDFEVASLCLSAVSQAPPGNHQERLTELNYFQEKLFREALRRPSIMARWTSQPSWCNLPTNLKQAMLRAALIGGHSDLAKAILEATNEHERLALSQTLLALLPDDGHAGSAANWQSLAKATWAKLSWQQRGYLLLRGSIAPASAGWAALEDTVPLLVRSSETPFMIETKRRLNPQPQCVCPIMSTLVHLSPWSLNLFGFMQVKSLIEAIARLKIRSEHANDLEYHKRAYGIAFSFQRLDKLYATALQQQAWLWGLLPLMLALVIVQHLSWMVATLVRMVVEGVCAALPPIIFGGLFSVSTIIEGITECSPKDLLAPLFLVPAGIALAIQLPYCWFQALRHHLKHSTHRSQALWVTTGLGLAMAIPSPVSVALSPMWCALLSLPALGCPPMVVALATIMISAVVGCYLGNLLWQYQTHRLQPRVLANKPSNAQQVTTDFFNRTTGGPKQVSTLSDEDHEENPVTVLGKCYFGN